MLFFEVVLLAQNCLRVNKLRSCLTMLGVAVGVFSIIFVVTATASIKISIESGLSYLGSNVFQFSKFSPLDRRGRGLRGQFANRKDITYRQALTYTRLMRAAGVAISLKVYDGNKRVTYGRLTTNANIDVCGCNENFLASNGYSLQEGRNFNETDISVSREVTIIGNDILRRLFPIESALGKVIKINGRHFTIIGVLNEKGTSFGRSQDNLVLTPISRFFNEFGYSRRSVTIATQSTSQSSYPQTLSAAIGAMRVARALPPGAENDFELYSNDSLVQAFEQISEIVEAGAFIVSSIALIAAGIGIMNIMLVSVAERTNEIGLRKSVGATRRDILRQFLLEAVILSEVGGAAGGLLGIASGNILARLIKGEVLVPWGWAAAALGFCSLLGLVFGIYPAWCAASLNPVDALRRE